MLKHVELKPDTSYDFDDLRSKLSDRTRVVAFAWASNAVGTVTDAAEVCRIAHEAGALAWIDAVHYAAHEPIDVRAIGRRRAAVLAIQVLWASPSAWRTHARPCPRSGGRIRRSQLQAIRSDDASVTGTLPYELLAGFNATIDYLDSVGGFDTIVPFERALGERFLATLPETVKVYGLPTREGPRADLLVNVEGTAAADVAASLAARDIGVWAHDSWYSLNLYKRLGYDKDAVRIGFIHYNTPEEVDRLVEALGGLRSGRLNVPVRSITSMRSTGHR